MYTRKQFDMYSCVSLSWCVVWQKNDMVFWLILVIYSEKHITQRIKYKEDHIKGCVLEIICFSLWFWLWYGFNNRPLNKKHIALLSKSTLRRADKIIHIKLVSYICSHKNMFRRIFKGHFYSERQELSNNSVKYVQTTTLEENSQ